MKIALSLTSRHPKGYVALISVIVLGATTLAITVSLLLQGILSSKTSQSAQHKNQARMAATSCAEDALQLILDTGIESGVGSAVIGSSTCSYTISSTSSNNILVQSSGAMGRSVSKIVVYLASSTPRIKLSSWQEVAGF